MSLTIVAMGVAVPQGSMKHVGRGRMVHSNKNLEAWRQTVIAAAQKAHPAYWEPMDGPVFMHVDVFLPKPMSTKFRDFPAGTPDLDKIIRGIGDALKIAGTITDDARVVSIHGNKYWAIGCEPCAIIDVGPKVLL